jgi:hypothetical protein
METLFHPLLLVLENYWIERILKMRFEMKKNIILSPLIMTILLVGCIRSSEIPTFSPGLIKITDSTGGVQPLIYGWRLGDELIMSFEQVTFAVLGIRLSETEIKLFFSLSGEDIPQFLKDKKIELIDDNSRMIDLLYAVQLSKFKNLEIGLLSFGSRYPGATELSLQIADKGEQETRLKMLLAQFDGPSTEDRLFSTYKAAKRGGVEQSGNHVQMYLSLPPSENAISKLPRMDTRQTESGATVTPGYAWDIAWADQPEGIEVYDLISFSIESLAEKQVEYLAVQILSDGNAIAAVDRSVIVPTPIFLLTPTPSLTPRPYPIMETPAPFDSLPYPIMVTPGPLASTLYP